MVLVVGWLWVGHGQRPRRLGAKLASFIGWAEVVFAALYAWLLLGQMPSPMEFLGGAFMLAGVVLVRTDENQPPPAARQARTSSTTAGPGTSR